MPFWTSIGSWRQILGRQLECDMAHLYLPELGGFRSSPWDIVVITLFAIEQMIRLEIQNFVESSGKRLQNLWEVFWGHILWLRWVGRRTTWWTVSVPWVRMALGMMWVRLFLLQIARRSIPRAGRVNVRLPVGLQTEIFMTACVGRVRSRAWMARTRRLLVYMGPLPWRFGDIIYTFRKLSDGFRQVCRNSAVVQHFVDIAFGVGSERFAEVVVLYNALGYVPNKWSRLKRSTCRSANGGVGLPTPYRIHDSLDSFNDCSVELPEEGFVVSKEACCECIFHRGIDLFA